ncbi:MAG TPA: hypothetical protein VKU41_05350 [Polyangiaceae bacterium]|nr:hypothetical protein [Polyangiaceae bacterium]
MKAVAGLAAAACWLLGATAQAAGDSPTVIVLRGQVKDAVTSEAAARVQGELVAAGFRVVILPAAGADTEGELESAGRELAPVAAFAIVVRPSSGAEIWVTDRVKHSTVIEHAQLSGDRNREAEILAVRAVELLKASLAELWIPDSSPATAKPPVQPTAERPAAPRPAPVESPEPAAPRAPYAEGLGVGVGAGVVDGAGAIGATWAPTAQISYGTPSGLGARATFAMALPNTLTATAGSARIDQQLATLEVVQVFWPRGAVAPFACAGAGVQHLRVDGKGAPPYFGLVSDEWSVLASAGAGIGVPLLAQWSFVAQGRAALGFPQTTIRIGSTEVARLDAPTLLLDAGILAVFR